MRGLCHCFHLLQEEFSGEAVGFIVGVLVVGAIREMEHKGNGTKWDNSFLL